LVRLGQVDFCQSLHRRDERAREREGDWSDKKQPDVYASTLLEMKPFHERADLSGSGVRAADSVSAIERLVRRHPTSLLTLWAPAYNSAAVRMRRISIDESDESCWRISSDGSKLVYADRTSSSGKETVVEASLPGWATMGETSGGFLLVLA